MRHKFFNGCIVGEIVFCCNIKVASIFTGRWAVTIGMAFQAYCSMTTGYSLSICRNSRSYGAPTPHDVDTFLGQVSTKFVQWNEMTVPSSWPKSPLWFIINFNVNVPVLLLKGCWMKYQSFNTFHEKFNCVWSYCMKIQNFCFSVLHVEQNWNYKKRESERDRQTDN